MSANVTSSIDGSTGNVNCPGPNPLTGVPWSVGEIWGNLRNFHVDLSPHIRRPAWPRNRPICAGYPQTVHQSIPTAVSPAANAVFPPCEGWRTASLRHLRVPTPEGLLRPPGPPRSGCAGPGFPRPGPGKAARPPARWIRCRLTPAPRIGEGERGKRSSRPGRAAKGLGGDQTIVAVGSATSPGTTSLLWRFSRKG